MQNSKLISPMKLTSAKKQHINKPKKKLQQITQDCDYLMYNSTEDEDQLRLHVQENYRSTREFNTD